MKGYSGKKWFQLFWVALGLSIFTILSIVPANAADRFVAHDDGTVSDSETGLMWAARDNGTLINWYTARSYCRGYRGGGYTDWRMPTLAELSSLYDPQYKSKKGYHITHLIEITASSCWSSDTREFKAARFNFAYGRAYWVRQSFSGPGRVLPVRKDK